LLFKNNRNEREHASSAICFVFREFGLKDTISIGEISGKGEDDPVDLNETDQGKYSNRRVEILFNNLKWKNFE